MIEECYRFSSDRVDVELKFKDGVLESLDISFTPPEKELEEIGVSYYREVEELYPRLRVLIDQALDLVSKFLAREKDVYIMYRREEYSG